MPENPRAGKRPPRLSAFERIKRRALRHRGLLTEVQAECSCTRTFTGKNQYTNPVGCPVHWKEPTL